MKRFKAVVMLIATVIMLTACEEISQLPLGSSDRNSQAEYTEETEALTEYIAEIPEITSTEVDIIVEAENSNLGGNLYISDKRKGYSGEGYVTGFKGGKSDYLVMTTNIPVSQHYDLTIHAAADKKVNNTIMLNGDGVGSFVIEGNKKKFVSITFYGIYIEEGEAVIQIDKGSEEFDIDYIEINNNEEIYDDEYEIDSSPVSEKSSYETKDVLRYLKQNLGECTVTGQFVTDSKNTEIEHIYKITGQHPVIRFGDIGGYGKYKAPLSGELNAAREWDERGGIVGFMWYWNSPAEDSDVLASKTKFSLKEAVTEEDVACMGISDIQELCRKGTISRECLALIEDIDEVAEGFNELAEQGIPILWRPLHEAASGKYWWGASGEEAYIWLYNLMFDRMTKYHQLDNLIWIWNGQSKDYLVDDDKYDIASIDVYLSPNTKFGSRSSQYRWLKKNTEGKKLIALSECSSLPDIDDMLRDKSVWSFFGLYHGEYLTGFEKMPDEVYTKEEDLIRIYNAENTITLDEYAGVYGVK